MHLPVLLQVSTAGLGISPGETVLDCTVGLGGHSSLFCQELGAKGRLIGLDRDSEILEKAKTKLSACPGQVDLKLSNFRKLGHVLSEMGIDKVDVVFMDLGLNSEQLDESGRGFSFLKDEPLLMTFETKAPEGGFTAEEIVNEWSEENLATIIRAYGEEPFASRIARAIVEARDQKPLKRTQELVEVIRQAVPRWYTKRRLHFATKTFQALRIAVNDEIGSLKEAMAEAWQKLSEGGRLGIITFHGLEAKVVKDFFEEKLRAGEAEKVTKKVIKPEREEIIANPRSRSAQLRILKKII